MTSFDNALKSDEGNSVYPPDLAKAIFELDIPDRIYLKTAMEFDDKYIVNKGNKWTFDYSGSRRYLVFNQDYISNKLKCVLVTAVCIIALLRMVNIRLYLNASKKKSMN